MSLKFEPYEFVTALYKQKLKASKDKNKRAINDLKKNYPELFSVDFLADLLFETFIRMGCADKSRLH